MDMHGRIMNLPATPPSDYSDKATLEAYKTGHRDARHAAAELAQKADALAVVMRDVLEWARHEKTPLREQEVAEIERVLADYSALTQADPERL
jgi:hypothetical protein